ncbi:NarK/NasA family nitrate transporter [Calidifontibacter sp. DB0510]|uniref:NarK/NasA family nitrate transporter n=1 Tax=Metallococcus carri TaxID=1656884 RepID=A0A967B1K8_9MICO|nr:nitrate/nitrite transporter [Metallococcus carri]NHN57126.1 NarK/NasA family nitrate transporter [Metallococcus carri]NOP39005.1 NarK/NasA family nitrate transporter [Calidifontibacter sp. DB2511S]
MALTPSDLRSAESGTAELRRRPGRWIDGWDPENPVQWDLAGRSIARRNLWLSVFAEFLGFGVFALWGIVVPQLAAYGYTGSAAITDTQQFWLLSIPTLLGATLRIPYSFAVPRFGGRNWTIASALLLLIPVVGLALAISARAPFPVLFIVAAFAGLGGGNFASSMTNISFFYPAAQKGKALGLNAAGGNVGTAAVQFAVPFVVVFGAATVADPNLPLAGWVFVPLCLIAAFLAWRFMDNLSAAHGDPGAMARAVRRPHTWLLSFLYIGTFGSFIGFAGAFPKVLHDAFPSHGLKLAFLGALVGSLSRPLGGIVADRVGGWVVTVVSFIAMAAGAAGAVYALSTKDFGIFMVSFLWLFVFTGVGNGSVYRMIPAVFDATSERATARRLAAGAIGIVGAIGAFGGFLVPQAFSLAKAQTRGAAHPTGTIVPALQGILVLYVVMAIVTWAVYGRRGSSLREHRV